MNSNLDKYEGALERLISQGESLFLSLQKSCDPSGVAKAFEKAFGKNANEKLKELPTFHTDYQVWYSEAKAVIKQVLADRLTDFTGHYEKPKPRKDITYATYRIEDCLQGITVTRGYAKENV